MLFYTWGVNVLEFYESGLNDGFFERGNFLHEYVRVHYIRLCDYIELTQQANLELALVSRSSAEP